MAALRLGKERCLTWTRLAICVGLSNVTCQDLLSKLFRVHHNVWKRNKAGTEVKWQKTDRCRTLYHRWPFRPWRNKKRMGLLELSYSDGEKLEQWEKGGGKRQENSGNMRQERSWILAEVCDCVCFSCVHLLQEYGPLLSVILQHKLMDTPWRLPESLLKLLAFGKESPEDEKKIELVSVGEGVALSHLRRLCDWSCFCWPCAGLPLAVTMASLSSSPRLIYTSLTTGREYLSQPPTTNKFSLQSGKQFKLTIECEEMYLLLPADCTCNTQIQAVFPTPFSGNAILASWLLLYPRSYSLQDVFLWTSDLYF